MPWQTEIDDEPEDEAARALLAMGVTACAGMTEHECDTVVGAGVGTAIGAGVTGDVGGAAVAGVVGGVIGNQIGRHD